MSNSANIFDIDMAYSNPFGCWQDSQHYHYDHHDYHVVDPETFYDIMIDSDGSNQYFSNQYAYNQDPHQTYNGNQFETIFDHSDGLGQIRLGQMLQYDPLHMETNHSTHHLIPAQEINHHTIQLNTQLNDISAPDRIANPINDTIFISNGINNLGNSFLNDYNSRNDYSLNSNLDIHSKLEVCNVNPVELALQPLIDTALNQNLFITPTIMTNSSNTMDQNLSYHQNDMNYSIQQVPISLHPGMTGIPGNPRLSSGQMEGNLSNQILSYFE